MCLHLPTPQRPVLLEFHIQTLMSLCDWIVLALITLSFVSVQKDSWKACQQPPPPLQNRHFFCNHYLWSSMSPSLEKNTKISIIFRHIRICLWKSHVLILMVLFSHKMGDFCCCFSPSFHFLHLISERFRMIQIIVKLVLLIIPLFHFSFLVNLAKQWAN